MRAVVVHGARTRRQILQTARDARVRFGICVREVLEQCAQGLRTKDSAIVALERFYAAQAVDYMGTVGASAAVWRSHGPAVTLEEIREAARTEEGWARLLEGRA